MLLLCPTWLSSLLDYLVRVIFVLHLPLKRYLGFFIMEITFQSKKNRCCHLKFLKLSHCNRNCLSDTVVFYIILEYIPHNTLC